MADESPIPPRFRWLKRFIIAGLLLTVALFALRLWWGQEAQSRLNAQIARYRASGGPVTVADFVAAQTALDAEDNVAALINEAITLIVTDPSIDLHYFSSGQKANRPYFRARPLLEANEPVLALLRRARNGGQKARWDVQLDSPASWFAPLNKLRTLCQVSRFAASYYFESGDHAAAIATLRDGLALRDAIGEYPIALWFLTSTASHRSLCSLITRYGHQLQTVSDFRTTAADRQEVGALLADLLDDRRTQAQAIQAQLGSRASTLHQVQTATFIVALGPGIPAAFTWPPVTGAADWLGRPLVLLDYAANAELENMAARAMAEPDWPRARSRIKPPQLESAMLQRLTQPGARIAWAATRYQRVERTVQVLYRALAERRMAATALAIRLYELDNGTRPEKLTELVPDYLPALPRDPFSAEGNTFRYASDRTRLFSAGPDRVFGETHSSATPMLESQFDDDNIIFKLEPDGT